MTSKRAFFLIAAVFAGLFAAHAQPSAIQQLQNSQWRAFTAPPELRVGTNAPEIYQGENADIGPQRILRVNQKPAGLSPDIFDLFFDSQVFYTDNANYGGATERIGSLVFLNTAQIALAPDPISFGPGKFAPSVGFSSQWYTYERTAMSAFDFNAQTAFLNARYLLGNWQLNFSGSYTRLLSQDSGAETYQEFLPALSLQRVFIFRDNLALVVGDAVAYHFTTVPPVPGNRRDINDHLDDTLYLTVNWQATRKLVIQPFYHLQYAYYPNDTLMLGSRTDWLNSVGINVIYSFNKYASVRAFFSYNTKNSDDHFTSHYDELNGGIGASLNLRF